MVVYTDGSFSKKVSMTAAGYAAIIVTEETDEAFVVDIVYGKNTDPQYTAMWNVGGELWAALVAVNYAKEFSPKDIDLYYDYAGVEHWVTKRWQAKNPITQAYGRHMRSFQKEIPIRFHQVRGHTGVQLNELADEYAKKGLLCKDSTPQYMTGIKILKK